MRLARTTSTTYCSVGVNKEPSIHFNLCTKNELNDESGNGNNGTVNGAAHTIDRFGNANGAYSFNAFNWNWGSGGDYISIPYNSIFNSSNITVSAWFLKSDNYITNQSFPTIIKRYNGGYDNPNGQSWGMYPDKTQNDKLKTFLLPPNTTNTYTFWLDQIGPEVTSNIWHHAVLTFDGIFMKTYYDDQLVASSPSNGMVLNNLGYSLLSIGMSIQANGNWDPFNGSIDDIALYNRALTQQEITNLYNASTTLTSPCPTLPLNLQNGLVGYWPFCGNAND